MDTGEFGPISELANLETEASELEGFVEFHGMREAADCCVFGGWVSRRWATETDRRLCAIFENGTIEGEAPPAFHDRDDLGERGVGFVVAFGPAKRRMGRLLSLELRYKDRQVALRATVNAQELNDAHVAERADVILRRSWPEKAAGPARAVLAQRFVGEGYIDSYGYHLPSAGWLLCGWISNAWLAAGTDAPDASLHFAEGKIITPALLAHYERDDIVGKGQGIILHVPAPEGDLGALLSARLRAANAVVSMRPAGGMELLTGGGVIQRLTPLLPLVAPGRARDTMQALTARPIYTGTDTLASLPEKVLFGADEVIACPPGDLLVCGWLLARRGAVKRLRVRSGKRIFPVNLDAGRLAVDRPDVISALGEAAGFTDPRCGFVVRIPVEMPLAADAHFEFEAEGGRVGFSPLPASRLAGLPAIKRVLSVVDTGQGDLDHIYDEILGPTVRALNEQRLAVPPEVNTRQFGPAIAQPRFSVIVPLYGRVDFMEFQLALFACHGLEPDAELIYVLDDPTLQRETLTLATSLYERFGVPFRLLLLSRNVGFAPANNVALAVAGGEFVCFLNSDVFPTTGDWLTRLAARLDADDKLGAVGPMLLFEDGSVQHQGISFKRLPQLGGWAFPQHPRKGWRPPATRGLARPHAITGACILLRRTVAVANGGFDEAFVIGDFEDTDLCFRLRAQGLHVAVDMDVTAYHLERKSQANSAQGWRTNLTLFNAWTHERRWGGLIDGLGLTT